MPKSRFLGGTDLLEIDEQRVDNEIPVAKQIITEEQKTADTDAIEEKQFEEEAVSTEEIPAEGLKELPSDLEVTTIETERQPAIEVISPTASKTNTRSAKKSSSQLLQNHLEDRISKIEMMVKEREIPDSFFKGLPIMKDRLDLTIEQLLLLTYLTLSKTVDVSRVQQLHVMAQSLQKAKRENIFIDSCNCIQIPNIPLLDWNSSDLQLNETHSETDVLKTRSSVLNNGMPSNKDDLEIHLCYSPDKLLDQLMELKSEVCLLTNKVNEVSARLLEHESQRTLVLIYEIQNQIQDLKSITANLKDQHILIESRLTSNFSSIDNIKRTMEEIIVEKVDKNQIKIEMADKVDYKQLQRKVSLDQMLELQCRIDKRFCEVLRQIADIDKKFTFSIENIRESLGFSAIEGVLKTFKDNIAKDVQSLHNLLKTYIDSTNDDGAAAGARIKVLQDLACLSCNTTCVMRSMEKAKVGKLPCAHASTIISPLITYELGSIRKSGIIGYYRKDEFPHATNAWLNRQSNALKDIKHCVPRHAGGEHTLNNAKDRVQKVMLNKK